MPSNYPANKKCWIKRCQSDFVGYVKFHGRERGMCAPHMKTYGTSYEKQLRDKKD
jgi:hypothetical protein